MNVSFKPQVSFAEINKLIKDEDGNMIAEINCFDYAWKCLYVGALWVKEEYRKSVLGSKLLTDLETVARKYEVQSWKNGLLESLVLINSYTKMP
ncbi:GNAT family N-acetyltransferase [Paenibacillus alvei]|uniref:N-acetyltransferase domain-containing protein n=1 Tax=Paenibacillus alvei TaxID=44250 RepID=A0A383RDD7_PAEAL|nr:GNAT family N-acetyltransferase [Paenibacillus alvei]SYX85038.1 protein of unknown function [Paenibacillus alvei]